MKMNQVASILNTVNKEIIGEEAIVSEDLSNIVDVGVTVLNATSYDNYVKKLADHIAKVVCAIRPYKGGAPKVFMDNYEFGAIIEKISYNLPEAQDNSTWNLQNGQSYDPNVFTSPEITVKFYSNRETFEIPMSITTKQVKSAFSDAVQMNAFISGIYTAIDNAITLRFDSLIMRTINNFTGEVLHHNYPDGNYNATSHATAVNLLHDYNAEYGTALTTDNCMHTPEFLRYCAKVIRKYVDWLKLESVKYNIGGQTRFTTEDKLHLVLLSDFAINSQYDMQSDTFHKDLVSLPKYETVPYWQAPGDSTPSFANNSEIHVAIASDKSEVEAGGIIGVMFDHDALGVTNHRDYTTSQFNARAEFTNIWHKVEAGCFNDSNENYIVFFVA